MDKRVFESKNKWVYANGIHSYKDALHTILLSINMKHTISLIMLHGRRKVFFEGLQGHAV